MELFIRAAAIYLFLFVLLRAAGHRQFSQMTAFDLVLILIIAEATGQALVGEDYSITGAVVVIATLVGIDLAVSFVKQHSDRFNAVVEGIPTLLVNKGVVLEENLRRERVRKEEILDAARESQGLEALEQVKYAVLEPGGTISIVPWEDEAP